MSSNVQIIAVPYDSGRRGERMGAGPIHLIDAGVAEDLEKIGFDVSVEMIDLPAGFWPSEVASTFKLAQSVGESVQRALAEGAFPIILAGNCAPAALGAVAGIGGSPTIFWFDAHGDFNTPETTSSGFVDGTALAALCGRCWQGVSEKFGFQPVPEGSVVLVGARDLDVAEAALLRSSDVKQVPAAEVEHHMPNVLASLGVERRSYVHLDLDVLDVNEGRVNEFAAPHGLSTSQLEWVVGQILEHTRVAAVSITAYDPAFDSNGNMAQKAKRLIQAIAAKHLSRAGAE